MATENARDAKFSFRLIPACSRPIPDGSVVNWLDEEELVVSRIDFVPRLNRRSDRRPDSPLGAPTTDAVLPPFLVRRNDRHARDSKFVLLPPLGPSSHRNPWLLAARPNYRQRLSRAPRQSGPTTFCSSWRYSRSEPSDLFSLCSLDPPLECSLYQTAPRFSGSKQKHEGSALLVLCRRFDS